MIEAFLSAPLAQRLGWVFLHFLWQGALVAGALALVLACLRGSARRGPRDAQARYLASCLALVAMAALPVATFLWIDAPVSATSPVLGPHAASPELAAATKLPPVGPASLVPALTLFWAIGALVQELRMIVSWIGAERLRRRLRLPAPEPWPEIVAALARELEIRRPVEVCESALARVPTLVGWLRPVILVPTAAFLHLSPEQLRTVLAHELAHVRRHDYLVNLIQTAIESGLFFHPAVWWLSHRLRVEREYCCDDLAVRTCGDPLTHARALERLESLRASDPRPIHPFSRGVPAGPRPAAALTTTALSSTGGSLMKRIDRLVRPETSPRRGFAFSLVPAALAATGLLSAASFGWSPDEGSRTETVSLQDGTDELNARVRDLRRQIAELEKKLAEVRGRRGGGDDLHRDDEHAAPHRAPRSEHGREHGNERHAEDRDVRRHFGFDPEELKRRIHEDVKKHFDDRDLHERHARDREDKREANVPFGIDPEHLKHGIHEQVQKLLKEHNVHVERFGDDGKFGFRVEGPDLHFEFDPEELEGLHEKLRKHLDEFDFESFGDDFRFGFDPEALQRKIHENVEKHLKQHRVRIERRGDDGSFEFEMEDPDIRFGFDPDELKAHLKRFNVELGDGLEDFEFHFDPEEMKQHFKRFNVELGDGQEGFEFHFDPEEMKEHFKRFHDRLPGEIRQKLEGLNLKSLEGLKALEELDPIRIDLDDLDLDKNEIHRRIKKHLEDGHAEEASEKRDASDDDWV